MCNAPRCCGSSMYFDIYSGRYTCLDFACPHEAARIAAETPREELALGYRPRLPAKVLAAVEQDDSREYTEGNR